KPVRGARLDIHKIHLQDVARRGAFHSDRSKQDMWSGAAIFDFGVDGPQLADVIVLGRVEARESIGVSAYGFHANGFAGFDRDHRFGVGVISSPLDICGMAFSTFVCAPACGRKPVASAGRTKQSNRFMAYQTTRIVPMDKKYDRCQRFLAAVQDFRSLGLEKFLQQVLCDSLAILAGGANLVTWGCVW